jgi:sporulation integral membrane protein YlbJ
MLLCETAGVLLYISHVLSAITIGIIFRFYKSNEKIPSLREYTPETYKQNLGEVLSSSISESVELILYVCGFVVFFSVLLNILEISGILELFKSIFTSFGVPKDVATAVSFGFFEMVNGVKKISTLPIGNIKLVLISIIISWGGVSVLLQVFGIISKYGFSKKIFIAAKAMQGIFAGLYMLILLQLPLGDVAVFAQKGTHFTMSGAWAYSILLLMIAIIFYFFLSTAFFIVKTVTKL